MTDILYGHALSGVTGGATWKKDPVATKRVGGSASLPTAVFDVRRKHGFKPNGNVRTSAKSWRDGVLSGSIKLDGIEIPPSVPGEWPRNRGVLDALKERFRVLGFDWKEGSGNIKGRDCRWVVLVNQPKVGGYTPNLADLLLIDPEMVDGFEQAAGVSKFSAQIDMPVGAEVEEIRARMDATHVGYKGFEGVSWRQAMEPFVLPPDFLDKLGVIGRALTLGFQAVRELWESDASLRALLTHGKPDRIPALMLGTHVGLMRPDIVIVQDPTSGELRPVITELESCPGGQGMAHAMEHGYGLPTTMVDGYVRMLRGRRLIIFATGEWAEYTWEQACFIKALRDRGVDTQIWFDKSLQQIHDRVQKDWVPHRDISPEARGKWNRDFLGRLKTYGFDAFVHGSDEGLPQDLGPETVVYRFGYFDNYVNTDGLQWLQRWHSQGAYIMNPLWFALESKGLMAAFWHPSVMEWIRLRDPQALTTLHNGVAETHSITQYPQAVADVPRDWLTKIAAWDGDNQSWGSRGVEFGSQSQSAHAWLEHLKTCRNKSHPSVVQHMILSHRYSVAYRDQHGRLQVERAARTRLTPFFLFHEDDTVELVGSTITLRANSLRIHGADDAIEGPAVFAEEA